MELAELLGKMNTFYDKNSKPEDVLRLLSAGAQIEENGIMFLDKDRKPVYANNHAFTMFYADDSLKDLYGRFTGWMRACGIEQSVADWCKIYSCDGKDRMYRVRSRRLLDYDGKAIGFIYIIRNLSDIADSEVGEQYKLTHDELTGLYNKEGFSREVRRILDQSKDTTYLLLYSNIKDFKLINQLFGIERGNEMIISVAEMIQQKVKPGDAYGRINGDHFALMMPKERFDEKAIKKQVKVLTSKVTSSAYSLHIQIGVYEIKTPGMDVSLMCDRAYMACKYIKRDGACEISWYSDEMLVNALLEKEILSSFDFAIINRQFGIYLQPQVYEDGTVYGAEALARWIHPENGLIQPGVFISVLEKADLIYKLDRYIWELAAMRLQEWKGTAMENVCISVNVSPKDLYYLDIKKEFLGMVEKYDIDPKHLNIEITETAVTSDVAKCAKLIQDLQASGFIVEIDDFGSGYSSLNMLKDINANILKIDMGFLRKTENLRRAQVILNYTIDMAHELGMEVVTEGVENKEQLEFLKGIGCKLYQGYYFDKPMPADDFVKKYGK